MNQDKIWEAYQNEEALLGMGCPGGGRIEYIGKKIPNTSAVLNIGVGGGRLEKLLVAKGTNVFCLDPSNTSIERLREELGLGQNARVGYSQAIPFADKSFDIVVMTEVLEHLSNIDLTATVREVSRVLKPNGRFIGSVPAEENLTQSLVVCPHCEERFHRWGHEQSFSRERLEAVLEEVFPQVAVRRLVFMDSKTLNWKGRLAGYARQMQAGLGLKGQNQNFYFEASRT